MKLKSQRTKLTLHRETLRRLSENELIDVEGGLETTPIGTCTANEPCMSTVRN